MRQSAVSQAITNRRPRDDGGCCSGATLSGVDNSPGATTWLPLGFSSAISVRGPAPLADILRDMGLDWLTACRYANSSQVRYCGPEP
jgi:hypothetical protein